MEKEELLRRLRRELDGEEELTDDEVRQRITQLLSGGAGETYLPLKERSALSRELFSAVRRLDLLQDLLEDPTVTEIMVNGPDAVFVERTGTVERLDLAFPSQELLMDIISRVAGACNRVINERSPIVDARLPDGSRVNAVVFPAALKWSDPHDPPFSRRSHYHGDPAPVREHYEGGGGFSAGGGPRGVFHADRRRHFGRQDDLPQCAL